MQQYFWKIKEKALELERKSNVKKVRISLNSSFLKIDGMPIKIISDALGFDHFVDVSQKEDYKFLIEYDHSKAY